MFDLTSFLWGGLTAYYMLVCYCIFTNKSTQQNISIKFRLNAFGVLCIVYLGLMFFIKEAVSLLGF